MVGVKALALDEIVYPPAFAGAAGRDRHGLLQRPREFQLPQRGPSDETMIERH